MGQTLMSILTVSCPWLRGARVTFAFGGTRRACPRGPAGASHVERGNSGRGLLLGQAENWWVSLPLTHPTKLLLGQAENWWVSLPLTHPTKRPTEISSNDAEP